MSGKIRDGNLRQASVYIRSILDAPYPPGDAAGQARALLAGQVMTAIERLDTALPVDKRHVRWIWSPPEPPSPPIFNKRIYGLLHQILELVQSSGQSQLAEKLDNLTAIAERMEIKMSEMDDKITATQADVAAEGNVIDSAVVLLNGISQRIADAVADALAKGATAAQLQAMTDLDAAVKTKTTDLAAAVAAGTPAAP